MNKWYAIFGISSAIILSGLLGGSSASAVSDFDDLQTVDHIEIRSPNGNNIEDVTTSWADIMQEYCPTQYLSYTTAINTGLNPAWVLKQVQMFDAGNPRYLSVSFIDDVTNEPNAYFYQDSAHKTLAMYGYTNLEGFTLGIDNTGTYECDPVNTTTGIWYQSKTDINHWFRPLLAYNVPIDYGIDYEGEIIPDTYTPPTPPLDWIPDFHVLQGIDYKVTIQDKSFNTFDEVPFTCNDGLTPVIKYEIRDSSNEIVVIGQFSATIQLEQQLPKNNIESTYTIIGNYDCGFFSDPTQPDFSGQASKEFTITAGGLLENEVFTSCFIETAPFIDFENCLNNMADTVGMLSFGSIKFSNSWQFDSNCRELAVLGGWIGLEGSAKVICPQFPEYIRNVVTPFVTLLLGFITLKFITSRGGSGI